VVKIRDEDLPRAANIHWLGGRDYAELPAYLAHWNVALMPFALNEATRFISPTKAPEYLAGGKPVVSTPVADVVSRYAASTRSRSSRAWTAFVAACETALSWKELPDQPQVDELLTAASWDGIHAAMAALLHRARASPRRPCASCPSKAPDYLVVGGGFAGSIMAERLANNGAKVLVVDRRSHIAGNAFDEHDQRGRADPPLRPAHLPHQQRRGAGLSQPLHPVAPLRAPRARPRSRGSCCPCRSTAPPCPSCSTRTSDRRGGGELPQEPR
jgi:UDP-galactopyranose mutase